MNSFSSHETLFDELMRLCQIQGSPFYFKDQSMDGATFRVFAYHFIDHNAWAMSPFARECRGTMFYLPEDQAPKLVCLPVHKFFNIGEPIKEVYTEPPTVIMDKIDGSLISSFRHPLTGQIRVKSKTSIHSDFAKVAQCWIDQNPDMYNFLESMEQQEHTVNLELVNPDPKYRVVIFYDQLFMYVLNARHLKTGKYLSFAELEATCESFFGHRSPEKRPLVKLKKIESGQSWNLRDHLNDDTIGIEGYVLIDQNENWWKAKSAWYLARHRAKDLLNLPKRFIELVIKEESDDVMAMFADQPKLIATASLIESKTLQFINQTIRTVSDFYQNNQTLDRKSFAIKGTAELSSMEFPLAMMMFVKNGEEPDWKAYFIKQVDRIFDMLEIGKIITPTQLLEEE